MRQMLIGFVCKYQEKKLFRHSEVFSRECAVEKNLTHDRFPGSILIIDCGLHEGWSTPTIPKFNGDDPLKVTTDEIAWIVNLMYVGVGIGSLVPFLLMDNIGRKGTLLVTTIPKIISWFFIGLSTSVSFIYVGRILAGIGCGITYAVMPMYLGEISSKRTRGPLGTTMSAVSRVCYQCTMLDTILNVVLTYLSFYIENICIGRYVPYMIFVNIKCVSIFFTSW